MIHLPYVSHSRIIREDVSFLLLFMYRTYKVKNILNRRIIPVRVAPMIIIKEVYKRNTEEEQRNALIKIIIRLLIRHNQGLV